MAIKKELKNYRHGDIALIGIKPIKDIGKYKSDSKIITGGNQGHSHSIDNGTLYFKQVNEFVFGYLEAKNTSLLHLEHGEKIENCVNSANQDLKNSLKKCKIEDGFYELRKQQEFINNELKPVID